MGQYSAVWEGYIPTLLEGGHCDKAAILSYDVSELEASTPDYKLSPEDIKAIAAAFKNPESVLQNGLTINGERFTFVRTFDKFLVGRSGKNGIALAKTQSCVLVGHHGESGITTNASSHIERIATHINGAPIY